MIGEWSSVGWPGALLAPGTLPGGSARVAAIPASDVSSWQAWLGVSLLMLAVAAVELAVIARRSGGKGSDADSDPAPAPAGDRAASTDPEPRVTDPDPTPSAVSPDGGADDPRTGRADDPRPEALLERAREQASAENAQRAVRVAYAAVHEDFSDEAPAESLTHWELYRELRDEVENERAAALRRLVELYERSVFGPGAVAASTATEAVSAAETLLGDRSDRSDGDSR